MKLKRNEILVLKRCIKDNKASNGFEYPLKGIVECLDWKDTVECGNGLHGWTKGFTSYFDSSLKGNFVIILVDKEDGYVELENKVKFKKGNVIYNSPDFLGAKKIMLAEYADFIFHWDTNKQGYSSTNTQGYSSTNTQGEYSTNTQGEYSTNTQGEYSTNTQGEYSTNTIFGNDNISRILSNFHATIMFFNNKMKVFQGGKDYFIGQTIRIEDMEIKDVYTTTPDKIEDLKTHEIFIFGSNLNGNHGGGAAKLAHEKFGAKTGIGEGLTGQSYAFPTLNKEMEFVSNEELKESVEKLIKCANDNTTKIFFLTKVGCGIAGATEDRMKEFFKDTPANIIKPLNW
jgi:hypothetical protein